MIGYGKIVFLAGLVDLGQDGDQTWKSHVTMELKKLGFSVINPATTFVVTRPVEDDEYLIELGYNVFSRDINSDIYRLDNVKEYFIYNGNIYIIFAYGNDKMTSEMDLVII